MAMTTRDSQDMNNWPTEYVRERHEWIVGWDIGQSVDPSAVCALEHTVKGGKLTLNEKTKTIRQQRVESFHVRHLERIALGTSYPQQIQHVANLLNREPLVGAKLVVDFTGVGRPVFDMAERAGLRPHGVLITAGHEVTRNGGSIYHVPKQILISQLEARLHSGELKIAADIADAGALAEELKDFARSVSAAGRVTFNARSGSHDDLVLAVAIALFLALGMNRTSHTELIF
jgi:hypothetical protein